MLSFIDARKFKVFEKKEFSYEVNEITWSPDGRFFLLTNGSGIAVLEYPSLKTVHTLQGHTANCICINFDSTGKYFAVGAADAIVSLWDAAELCCVRTFNRLDWPVRACKFSFDGNLLASASEDLFIDVADVETGEQIHQVSVPGALNTLAWRPSQYVFSYAGEKDRHGRQDFTVRVLYGNN